MRAGGKYANIDHPVNPPYGLRTWGLVAALLGIMILAVGNAAQYAQLLTDSTWSAILFCVPLALSGLIIEEMLFTAQGSLKKVLHRLVTLCKPLGIVAFLFGFLMEFLVEMPPEGWPTHWLWLLFAGQGAVEIACVNILASLIRKQGIERRRPQANPYWIDVGLPLKELVGQREDLIVQLSSARARLEWLEVWHQIAFPLNHEAQLLTLQAEKLRQLSSARSRLQWLEIQHQIFLPLTMESAFLKEREEVEEKLTAGRQRFGELTHLDQEAKGFLKDYCAS